MYLMFGWWSSNFGASLQKSDATHRASPRFKISGLFLKYRKILLQYFYKTYSYKKERVFIALLRCLCKEGITNWCNLAQAMIVTIVKQEPTISKNCWITFHVKITALLVLFFWNIYWTAHNSSSTQKEQLLKQYVAMKYFALLIDIKAEKLEIPTNHNAF